jgi:hypothetical protein
MKVWEVFLRTDLEGCVETAETGKKQGKTMKIANFTSRFPVMKRLFLSKSMEIAHFTSRFPDWERSLFYAERQKFCTFY